MKVLIERCCDSGQSPLLTLKIDGVEFLFGYAASRLLAKHDGETGVYGIFDDKVRLKRGVFWIDFDFGFSFFEKPLSALEMSKEIKRRVKLVDEAFKFMMPAINERIEFDI